jgi:uncharacterized protein YutE (UPF0331/DUF86 family)
MVDANVLSEKLKQLALRIAKVREHCPVEPEELAPDSDALDLVSFNLLLAIQTCIDLATHLISDEGWAPAATAREAFERLEEQGVISSKTTRSLRKAAGLRNLVAHGYGDINPAQLHAVASRELSDLERFATELSAWVAGRTGTGVGDLT